MAAISTKKNTVLQSTDGTKAVIDITAYPTTIVNSIRRSLLGLVRSVAMVAEPSKASSIRIIENTSRLNNQFLGLRISLIPVCLPPPVYGGELNVLDRYEVRIQKQATDPGIYNLTTDDIRVYDTQEKGFLPASIVQQMFPREKVDYPGLKNASNPLLIVPLRGPIGEKEGEKINIVAKLKIGVGKSHSCFSPVCNSTYEIVPIDPDAPTATLDAVGKGDNSRFRFVVETVTNRRPEILFLEAIDEMVRKLENVRMSIASAVKSGGKGVDCEIHQDANDILFRFMNEDHTLGTVAQDYLIRKLTRDAPDVINEWFVGYRIPHPLTPEMIIRIHLPDSLVNDDPKVTLSQLVDDWILPSLITAETDLKEIGAGVVDDIPDEHRHHPLEKLLSTDYMPTVERESHDATQDKLLQNIREPISPEDM